MQPLLKMRGVEKRFPLTRNARDRWKGLVNVLVKGDVPEGVSILQDINIDIRKGESLAIIGENGAGKSTLLKLITGVMEPSKGKICKTGTSAALLELGAGFDSEYSGIENIKMNAAMLGLDGSIIKNKISDIVEFADIGDAIHEPIKHYSSGMIVRLGFAIVVAVRPDLLITDEVLAVGDESFQKKCIRWMESYLHDGGTLLMVSHNIYQVQSLCKQAAWIHEGSIKMCGDVYGVCQSYLAWHEQKYSRQIEHDHAVNSAHHYQVTSLKLDGTKSDDHELCMGSDLGVDAEIYSPDNRPPVVLIGLTRADGTKVYGVASDHDNHVLTAFGKCKYKCRLVFRNIKLLPGSYTIRAHALDPEGLRLQDTMESSFTVTGQSREIGVVRLEHEWQ